MTSASMYLRPTANHTYGSATYSGGSSNYTNLNDASDSTKLQMNDDAGYVLFPLTDMAGNFAEVTSLTITLRCYQQPKAAAVLDFAQIVKADGSTALCSSVTATITTTAADYTMTPSSVYYTTSKTDWDGALLKVKQTALDGKAGIWLIEAYIELTYEEYIDGTEGDQSGYGVINADGDFYGVGSVPDSGYGTVNADGTFSGVGLMEANGRGDVHSDGILSGVGERTFTGYGEVVAFDGIYGVGQQNANGHGAVSSDDPFIGIGRVPDSGFGVITGSDSFVGVGRVPDSGFGTISATGSFTGVGEVPGNGYGTVTAAGSLAGTGLTTTGSDSALRRRLISMGA